MATSHLLHSNQKIGPPGQDGKITVEPLHGGERFVERGRTVIVEGWESAEHRRLIPAKHVPRWPAKNRRKLANRQVVFYAQSQEIGNRLIFFPMAKMHRGALANPSSHGTSFLLLSLSSTNSWTFVSNVAGRGRKNLTRRYGRYG